MLTRPAEPDLYLIEPDDLWREPVPRAVRDWREPVERIFHWAQTYLTRSHPELGRKGPVCPFTQPSLESSRFYLTLCPGDDLSQGSIAALLLRYRDWFLELAPRRGPGARLKTILVLFPEMRADQMEELIEGTQRKLRPGYVERGLMIGEFHPGPPSTPGLWNPDFRPLAAPLPMLVIRHMVPTDFPFLKGSKSLLAVYLNRFGEQLPVHLEDQVRETARRYGLPVPSVADLDTEAGESDGGRDSATGGRPPQTTARCDARGSG